MDFRRFPRLLLLDLERFRLFDDDDDLFVFDLDVERFRLFGDDDDNLFVLGLDERFLLFENARRSSR